MGGPNGPPLAFADVNTRLIIAAVAGALIALGTASPDVTGHRGCVLGSSAPTG
ncbi:hypothetical protein [Allokutzneria oryzae]|uniref:Uncharacterized protein n=1 Tax=Allokutzneria oryzae TaxID=1378989 RepID=A0ABV6A049_9PSEU